jgi:hypothetical protein
LSWFAIINQKRIANDYFAPDIFNSTLLNAESILEFRERIYTARNCKFAVGDRMSKDVPPDTQITALV